MRHPPLRPRRRKRRRRRDQVDTGRPRPARAASPGAARWPATGSPSPPRTPPGHQRDRYSAGAHRDGGDPATRRHADAGLPRPRTRPLPPQRDTDRAARGRARPGRRLRSAPPSDRPRVLADLRATLDCLQSRCSAVAGMVGLSVGGHVLLLIGQLDRLDRSQIADEQSRPLGSTPARHRRSRGSPVPRALSGPAHLS